MEACLRRPRAGAAPPASLRHASRGANCRTRRRTTPESAQQREQATTLKCRIGSTPSPQGSSSAELTLLASTDRLRPRMDLAKAKDQGMKWLIRIAVGGVLTIAASVALYVVFTLNFAYSKGERVGFVQKLSKRGWVCKTNEGDLAQVNMPGQPAEIFNFTVPDDNVSKEIESFAG